MKEMEELICKILDKYPFLSLPKGEKQCYIQGNHVFFKCYANTYSTSDYDVINGTTKTSKSEYIISANILPLNKYGGNWNRAETYNISDTSFKFNGIGCAVVIFKYPRLEIKRVLYFYINNPCNFVVEVCSNWLIMKNMETEYTYVINLDNLKVGISASIRGIGVSYGRFMVTFENNKNIIDENLSSFSLIDLQKNREYDLKTYLWAKGIKMVDCNNTRFDIQNNCLILYESGNEEPYYIDLDRIKRIAPQNYIRKESDGPPQGCITMSIEGYMATVELWNE